MKSIKKYFVFAFILSIIITSFVGFNKTAFASTASVSITASANSVAFGTSVTFTATPVNGGTMPTYQWKKNMLVWNSPTSSYVMMPIVISGATNSTYTYVPINGDSITVVMTSNLPGVTGSPATSNAIVMTVTYGTACPGTPTVSYNGKIYNTTLIGTQCWLNENLNVGTMVNVSQGQSNNNVVEKYCYNNVEANCDLFGGLYQWGEAVQYKNGATNTVNWNPVPTESVQGLCPAGWHMPTNTEYATMWSYLGGQAVAGGKIKEPSTTHWKSPNVGASNSSGFTLLPGGSRWGTGAPAGTFTYFNWEGYFWTSTTGQIPATDAWYGGATYSITGALNGQFYKVTGLSVRCLKSVGDVASVSISVSANPVNSGTLVTFTATPNNGGTNPTYQWKKNGVSISGATNSTYTYVPVNGDSITVIMTSNLPGVTGSPATSNAIVMTVTTITASVSIEASFNGTAVVFTATPNNGGTNPTYQWKKNGASISGATSSTYTYDPANGESISCVMTSNLPGVNGNPATSNTISSPGKVTGLIAASGNGQVVLSWTTPNNGGSPLTTYAVRYKLSSSSTFAPFPHPVSTATSIVVTGLTNGQSYDFFVKAVNLDNRNNGGTRSDIISVSPMASIQGNNLVAGVINSGIISNSNQETNADTISNLDPGTISMGLFTKSLSFGKKHSDVKKLQKFLNESGYVVKAEGAGSLGNETEYFGKATQLSLIKFQKEHNITPATGYLGPLTRAEINKILNNEI